LSNGSPVGELVGQLIAFGRRDIDGTAAAFQRQPFCGHSGDSVPHRLGRIATAGRLLQVQPITRQDAQLAKVRGGILQDLVAEPTAA
jgi:hypothetical protein